MKKIRNMIGLFILLVQVFIAPISGFAASAAPSGVKTFAPVGSNNGSWNDGVPLGGSYLAIDSDGIITGFATDKSGAQWNGQKFKNITDNILAYCLNFDQATPNGSSNPVGEVDELTSEQKYLLNNLLKLGYVERNGEIYKGKGVTTLSNIDAFVTTQWMVHEIVPTEGVDMSQFTITNPQLAAGVANLRAWIREDLSIKLEKNGETTEQAGTYNQQYTLTAPYELAGNAVITLSKDIEDAKISTTSGTFDISSTKGQTVNVGETFTITVPNTTPTDTITVIATGGTTSFTFMKYGRPADGQQQSLVIGDEYISNNEVAKNDMQWETEVPEIPEIGTTATDKTDGDKVIDPDKQVTITDAVNYTGLTPGKEYTVKGILMDKSTGKALEVEGKEVTGSTTFTPSKADGTVNVDFTFNASALKGKTIVVFETAYQGEKEVAVHADINDEGQTVKVPNPKIGTTATDKTDGDKVIDPDKQVTITD
uniref:VaFE repeat-containing surface-anchored protein n=1 Tax=Enterococcus songbeiensis TaxID=2559927 RepID=UPI001485B157